MNRISLLLFAAFITAMPAFAQAPLSSPLPEATHMDWNLAMNGGDCSDGQSIGNTALSTFFRTGDQFIVGQSFMAPCDGLIESITISVYNDGTGVAVDPAEGDLVLFEGEGGSGTQIASQPYSISPPTTPETFEDRVITFDTPVAVTMGSSYTYVLDTTTPPEFQVIGDNAVSYPDGIAYGATDGNPQNVVPIEEVLAEPAPYDMTFAVTFLAPVVANEAGSELPTTAALGASYPNPFNPTASVPFTVHETSDVRVSVFDALGREVAVLASGLHTPGRYTASFDAAGLPSGSYLYRLEANGEVQMRTMTLLK